MEMLETSIEICQRCNSGKADMHFRHQLKLEDCDISPELKSFLGKSNFEFLCAHCLSDLEKLMRKSQEIPFPSGKQQVIEGVHYYREKGCWVFTELYSLQRGYCCKQGCRHCAWGFKRSKS